MPLRPAGVILVSAYAATETGRSDLLDAADVVFDARDGPAAYVITGNPERSLENGLVLIAGVPIKRHLGRGQDGIPRVVRVAEVEILHVVRDMKGECGHDLLVLLVKVRRSGARHREPVSLQPILEA